MELESSGIADDVEGVDGVREAAGVSLLEPSMVEDAVVELWGGGRGSEPAMLEAEEGAGAWRYINISSSAEQAATGLNQAQQKGLRKTAQQAAGQCSGENASLRVQLASRRRGPGELYEAIAVSQGRRVSFKQAAAQGWMDGSTGRCDAEPASVFFSPFTASRKSPEVEDAPSAGAQEANKPAQKLPG